MPHHEKETGEFINFINNSTRTDSEKKSRNYAEFASQIKKVFHIFGKVIRHFKSSLCITSGTCEASSSLFMLLCTIHNTRFCGLSTYDDKTCFCIKRRSTKPCNWNARLIN